jgi:uncharacterized protein (DUF58 family)
MRRWFAQAVARWSARRHGRDTLPVRIARNRIYILPTRRGALLGLLLIAMLIGGLNYANNLALGLAFFLSALALTAMHHCHRNLLQLEVDVQTTVDGFAKAMASIEFVLHNDAPQPRYDIEISLDGANSLTTSIAAGARRREYLRIACGQRQVLEIPRFQLRTRYPFGWFRAWTYGQATITVHVAPAPKGLREPPPAPSQNGELARSHGPGDAEFAGLRPYHPGDATKRIAWKSFAHGAPLAVQSFSGGGHRPDVFDWRWLTDLDPESKLAQLCHWVLESDAENRRFGLWLPNQNIEPAAGVAQRRQCLRALAAFGTGTGR